MSRVSYQGRRCTRRDTVMALCRATIVFGAVAVVAALVIQPGNLRSEPRFAAIPSGVDRMETGSIGLQQPGAIRLDTGRGPAPCLELPDGSRRGGC
ncbi:hypothetical protein NDN16_02445 [Aureimonas altamirensis]|uniref:hypothetical protein n=1 Tax=Aureimonas altamirensis TaxID=370622 RepID=UPI002037546F|nr:hypothetical protein [Aureimonas altamirensis]MCM2502529.1 hypothetical protein [Aureimonas altamirensis]